MMLAHLRMKKVFQLQMTSLGTICQLPRQVYQMTSLETICQVQRQVLLTYFQSWLKTGLV